MKTFVSFNFQNLSRKCMWSEIHVSKNTNSLEYVLSMPKTCFVSHWDTLLHFQLHWKLLFWLSKCWKIRRKKRNVEAHLILHSSHVICNVTCRLHCVQNKRFFFLILHARLMNRVCVQPQHMCAWAYHRFCENCLYFNLNEIIIRKLKRKTYEWNKVPRERKKESLCSVHRWGQSIFLQWAAVEQTKQQQRENRATKSKISWKSRKESKPKKIGAIQKLMLKMKLWQTSSFSKRKKRKRKRLFIWWPRLPLYTNTHAVSERVCMFAQTTSCALYKHENFVPQ